MDISDEELLEIDSVIDAVDGAPVPVPRTARELQHGRITPAVVAQAAAVAATGFAAGAVTAAVVRATRSRKAVKARRPPAQIGGADVIATRSYLIDVHLLAPRD